MNNRLGLWFLDILGEAYSGWPFLPSPQFWKIDGYFPCTGTGDEYSNGNCIFWTAEDMCDEGALQASFEEPLEETISNLERKILDLRQEQAQRCTCLMRLEETPLPDIWAPPIITRKYTVRTDTLEVESPFRAFGKSVFGSHHGSTHQR